MTGIVHSLLGAAVGSLCNGGSKAFLAGIASHLAADLIPHKDLPPELDVPLMSAVLLGVAAKYGVKSSEFAGTVGGVLPDAEHALSRVSDYEPKFITHVDDGKYHARQTKTYLTQAVVGVGALLFLLYKSKK